MRHRLSNFLLAAAIACAPLASHAFETANGKRILVIGGQQAVSVMDPAQKYDFSIRTIQQATYDALLKYEGDPVELKPWLATSWTVNDDATVWTFKLDPRAKFQNGDPVDAAAVKASFERTQAEQGPGLDVHRFPQAREHQRRRPADAALHAQPSLRGLPQPAALVVRGQRQAGHGQRAQWRLWPAMADRSHRRLRPLPRQARRTQFLYELEAWDGYWKGWPQPEKARLGGIIYRVITENSSRRALARGEIDIAGSLSPEDLDQLESVKGVKIGRKAGTGMGGFGLKFNTQGKYMSDLNLRRALAYAFDYDSLLKIYNGRAR